MLFFSKHKKILYFLLLELLIAIIPPLVMAAEIKMEWNPNSESGLHGYKLYFGKSSGVYNGVLSDNTQSPITIPLADLSDPQNPTYTLTGLDNDTWYFSLTAYDNTSESGYASELSNGSQPAPELVPTLDQKGIIFLVIVLFIGFHKRKSLNSCADSATSG